MFQETTIFFYALGQIYAGDTGVRELTRGLATFPPKGESRSL